MSMNDAINDNLMTDTGEPKFGSQDEEISYLRKKLEETQTEFQEFQESSRELELEYETQIKQLEKKNDELLYQISHLEDENDQVKTKLNGYTTDTQHKLNDYQQQISQLTSMNDRLTGYIRELEQNNDDLERAQRALAASLEDFEGKLNQQIERNVLLENEVSEKEELECVVQRLKEEARDLRHELIANKNTDPSKRRQSSVPVEAAPPPVAASNGTTASPMQHHRPPNTSDSSKLSSSSSPPLPLPRQAAMVMSPSSRITALNIVSDLLRKVSALESKLVKN